MSKRCSTLHIAALLLAVGSLIAAAHASRAGAASRSLLNCDCAEQADYWAYNQCCAAGGLTTGLNMQVEDCRSCADDVGSGKAYACIECAKAEDEALAAACTECVQTHAADNEEWACRDCLKASTAEAQQSCIACLTTDTPAWQCLQTYAKK